MDMGTQEKSSKERLSPGKNYHKEVMDNPWLRCFDYGLAVAALGYGIYLQSGWWIAGGVIGLILAFINPGKRFKQFMEGRMLKRHK